MSTKKPVRKTWSQFMGTVLPCGHTEAQHMYHGEKVDGFKLDMSNCEAVTSLPAKPDQRVIDYLVELFDNQIGVGEDPVGFLIASHRALRQRIEDLRKVADWSVGYE